MGTKLVQQIGPFIQNHVRVLTAAKEQKDEDSVLKTVCVGTKDHPHAAVVVGQKYKCKHMLTCTDCKGAGEVDKVKCEACSATGKVNCTVEHSSYHPFPRGRENADGTFTVLPRELLDAESSVDQSLTDTLTWIPVPRDQVNRLGIPSGKFYYLGPENGPDAANYGLIRDFLLETADEWAWVTQWAYRTAPHTVVAEVHGDWIGIQQLADPADVQAAPRIDIPTYDPQWLAMARQAVPILKAEFDPAQFRDTRKDKIAAMLKTAETVAGAGEDAGTTTVVSTPDALVVQMRSWIEQNAGTVGASGDTPKKATKPRKRAAKPADKPPVQPLPDDVPANVTVVTPKKRAPRKTAAVKKSA